MTPKGPSGGRNSLDVRIYRYASMVDGAQYLSFDFVFVVFIRKQQQEKVINIQKSENLMCFAKEIKYINMYR